MVHVLFVCLGNICRSPMAEEVFKKVAKEKGYASMFHVDSAGTAGYHIGKQPDRRTLEVLAKNGLKSKHLGQKMGVEDLDKFDHIVVMDEANFEHVHNLFHKVKHRPPDAEKVFLIRDFDPEVRGVQEVPDPYYEPTEAFQEVYEILYRSSGPLVDHLVEIHGLESDPEEERPEDNED